MRSLRPCYFRLTDCRSVRGLVAGAARNVDVLAPAYNLLSTALHLSDSPPALHDGLYPGDHLEPSFAQYGLYTGTSFLVFAQKASLPLNMANNILDELLTGIPLLLQLTEQSYLSPDGKKRFKEVVRDRERVLRVR